MPEEILFKHERRMDRSAIADHLRAVADSLDAGESITLSSGSESVELDPPARPTFEVKAEREYGSGEDEEFSVEFELEWYPGEDDESGQFEVS